MPTIHHLIRHFETFQTKHRMLYIISFMILFWSLFDGILMFILPLLIEQSGFSESMMGLIIGSSSVAGMLFDFLLCRILKNVNFRRLYFFMLILSVCYILTLAYAHTIWLFLLAMVLWGFYFDLLNWSNFDFVGRHVAPEAHSSSFGIMRVFTALAYMLAPLIAGFLISEKIGYKPFAMSWIMLSISALFYILLLIIYKKESKKEKLFNAKTACKISLTQEFKLWKKVGNTILPVLILTFVLNTIDGFFWLIGPLIAESLGMSEKFSGLFMVAYTLPPLLVGWLVGTMTSRLGKKRTAFVSLLMGSLLIALFFFFKNQPIILILINFCASFCISLSWPAINGAYADYISEAPHIEKEIETLEDSSTNLGYVVGPILAGFSSQYLGHIETLALLGISSAIIAIILFKVTPRKIKLNTIA